MQVNVFEKDGVIIIQGAVVFETVASIEKSVSHIQQQHPLVSECRIDLAAVVEVNSAALGLLVQLKKQATQNGQAMMLVHPPERLLSLAQVYGVASWLGFSH
jgi:anti-anti-sigma factor